MDSILHVNETKPTYFQSDWWHRPISCFRPAPDLGIPIACHISDNSPSNTYTGYVEDAGSDLNTFKPCCPDDPSGTNVHLTQYNCVSTVCFTNDTSVAIRWPSCVVEAATKRIDAIKAAGKPYNRTGTDFVGQCEYVDYATLRKNIKSGASSQHLSFGWWLAALTLMAAVVAAHVS